MAPSFASWTETTLGGIRMFRGVPADVLLDLGARAEWHSYPVGTQLLNGRHARNWLFFLTSGLVEVRLQDGDRQEYGPGACIALRHALAKEWRAFSILATSPVTVGWLHRDDLLDGMTRCPPLAAAVGRALALRAQQPMLAQDDRHELDDRVAEGLIVAAARYLRPDGISTLPTLPDLSLWAALLGVVDADVQRSFTRLERAGLVRIVAGERMHVAVGKLRARLQEHRQTRSDDDLEH